MIVTSWGRALRGPCHAAGARTAQLPPRQARVASKADAFTRAAGWAGRWFTEGNVPVKVGMVLLAGVAALRERHGAEWQPPVALPGVRTVLAGETACRTAPVPRDRETWILWAVLALRAATGIRFALRLLRAERPPDAG